MASAIAGSPKVGLNMELKKESETISSFINMLLSSNEYNELSKDENRVENSSFIVSMIILE